MGNRNASGTLALVAAVINRAVLDLKEAPEGDKYKIYRVKRNAETARFFIMGDTCCSWCLALGIDYQAVREKAAALYRRGNENRQAIFNGGTRTGLYGLGNIT
jgi:hypothetical protein